MLKSDLIKIQDMIKYNSSDIKMYKLLSKTPGLTKKLSEIEENKNLNIEKILDAFSIKVWIERILLRFSWYVSSLYNFNFIKMK